MRQGSETRQLTRQVLVRFTEDDFEELHSEASDRRITVPELLRERSLGGSRAAS